MRNIFLCFLTVMLFAPDAICATGVSRATTKTDVKTDTTRTVATGRTTGARTTVNTTAARSEKTVARDKDVVSRSTVSRNPNAVVSRTAITPNTTSQTGEQGRSATTNVSKRSQTARIFEKFKERLRSNSSDRNIANRAATTNKTNKAITAKEVANAKELLEQTASLNKSCQEQYNECMDQFCAVVDTNQKRCSCSANLSKYSNVQEAVTNANAELNEVAQRIRYVGLSADEIRAIMTETQAEAELDNTKDTSTTRNMLSKIESLIKDPTSRTTMISDNDFGLDLDFDFSDESADIFSLDFLNANTDSISSKRGTALYNAAKRRCKVIIDNCKEVGATSTQITGNYDLAIDKDCIEYEQGLKKMNETLASNVRSAGLMLQKARLAVLQNKNQYDAKGCIGALETCMTDEMVCGSDYVKCLDPTKKYIDENGKVVLGQDITNITDFMTSYNNAMIDSAKLSTAAGVTINNSICKQSPNDDGTCVIKYLLSKIGTGATVKDGGLCRAVLDKCQQFTYNSAGKYNPYNDIVVNYIQRAMVNIKSAQQQIISDYASSCMTDVASCYNQQVTQVNSWSSVASVSSIRGVMTGACRNVALTCAYAVFADMCRDTSAGNQNVMNWVLQVTDSQSTANANCTPCNADNQRECLEGISEIFYQSLLCPENSLYDSSCINSNTENRRINGCVNRQCRCNNDYTTWNGSCLTSCTSSEYRNSYGTCTSCDSNCGSYTRYQDVQDTSGPTSGDDPNTSTCPTNASAANDCTAVDTDGTLGGCITTECRCDAAYETSNGSCVTPGGGEDVTCPDDSTYTATECANPSIPSQQVPEGCVATSCKCNSGYYSHNSQCIPDSVTCSDVHSEYDPSCTSTSVTNCVATSCKCISGYQVDNGICVPEHSESDPSFCYTAVDSTGAITGCVGNGYRCIADYSVWINPRGIAFCLPKCDDTTEYRDSSSGQCRTCIAGQTPDGGSATRDHTTCSSGSVPGDEPGGGEDEICSTSCSGGASCSTSCTSQSASGTLGGCLTNTCRCPSNSYVSTIGGQTQCITCPANSQYDSSCTSTSVSGCVSVGCKCTGSNVPNSGQCVANTCESYSSPDSSCTGPDNNQTPNGCVSNGCRCDSEYKTDVFSGFTAGGEPVTTYSCKPLHSTRNSGRCPTETSVNRNIEGCVMRYYICDSGYTVWNHTCRPSCLTTQYRDNNGDCRTCGAAMEASGGTSNMENNTCSMGGVIGIDDDIDP